MKVQVCRGKSCTERHSSYITTRLLADTAFYGYPSELVIEDCLCQGRCKEGPTVVFQGDVQVGINPVKASEILRRKIAEWKRMKKD